MKHYLDLVPISAKIHKKQSRMSIFCIVLAVFLVTTIFGMADMFIRSQILQAQQESGNWHIAIKNISNEEAAIIASRPDIEVFSPYGVLNYRGDLGYTLGGKDVAICGCDESYITEIWTDQLEEGVFPQTSNEALVTENAKQIMGVAIGDSIAVETPDGDKLNFTISGFMNNTASIMSGDSYGIILNTEDYCAIYTQLLKIDTALGIYHAKANRKNLFLMTSSFALSIILFLSFSVTVEFMQHTLTPLQPWTADLSIISPDNACAIDKALLDDLKENPVVDLAYGRKFAYEVPSVTNGIEKKMDLISYEQYQFDWAKDYLLEGSLESVQTDLGTGLIVYNSQNTIQIGDTVSLNTNGQSKEIQIVGMLSDCPFYSAAGVGTIICSEDTFEQITGESKYTVIDVQLVKGTTDEDVYVIRQMVDSSFTFADERMGNSSTMGTYYCFWLFIYGFLVLIAMITIFNIINSISMSVSARLKQYGAFRAIGVSMGQLSKMIVAEAFTYTIIGGVVGTVLGLFCNKLLFGMLISYRWGDAWTPPLPEVAVILLIVISSVILAVHGPIKRIRNMSIVDTISAQ